MKSIHCQLATAALAVLLLAPAAALASTPAGRQTGNTRDGVSASDIIASAQLTVRKVETEPNRLYLYDSESEETHVIVLSEKTKLTARRKKDFDGRRKLEFGDLAAGQKLKVTYRIDDGRITSIQVLEKAS